MIERCIYGIYNRISRTWYIGQTTNYKRRQDEHLEMLALGRHHSPHLQNSWNKYGADVFQFIILEKLPSGNLDGAEHNWMQSFRRYKALYNIRPSNLEQGTNYGKNKARSKRHRARRRTLKN